MTTATNDPVPPFCRIADADPHLRRFLFGGQRPGRRMEAMSCYWRFLLMNILVSRLNSREWNTWAHCWLASMKTGSSSLPGESEQDQRENAEGLVA
jgi:hypothetical protein